MNKNYVHGVVDVHRPDQSFSINHKKFNLENCLVLFFYYEYPPDKEKARKYFHIEYYKNFTPETIINLGFDIQREGAFYVFSVTEGEAKFMIEDIKGNPVNWLV